MIATSEAQSAAAARFSVLATACVAPRPAPRLLRTDPTLRLDDYARALAFWMNHPDERIGDVVVLENSGFPPDVLTKHVMHYVVGGARNLEVISYLAPPRPVELHYGYAEFQMIDNLMDRSTLLGEWFIKSTGRYRFMQISGLLDQFPENCNFLIDSKRQPAVPLLGRLQIHSVRTELFISNADFSTETYDRYTAPCESHRACSA